METSTARAIHDPAADFYIDALKKLQATGIPFLVGGAFAFSHYAHVPRDTKDIDVFVKQEDCPRVLEAFRRMGYSTEMPFPHWLGKIHAGEHFMDIIFNSGNGIARVDDLWFDHAPRTNVLGVIVRLSPVEEMIWSKAFIQERERFDGADIMHILRARAEQLDWARVMERYADRWQLLFTYLAFFTFVYPGEAHRLPARVLDELTARFTALRTAPAEDRVCRGTLVSRAQYLIDIGQYGYADARLAPRGGMSAEEAIFWTWAIDHVK